MKRLLVLGAGTAGTMMVNQLRRRLDRFDWAITVVDQAMTHVFQPGLLLVPFGSYTAEDVTRPRPELLGDGINLIHGEIDHICARTHTVALADGRQLPYDYLVIATGCTTRPDHTPGMLGRHWQQSIFDFYHLEGAVRLHEALRDFPGGRLVVHVADLPVRAPGAPLAFATLADSYLRREGRRDQVEIIYATPVPAAVATAPAHLGAGFGGGAGHGPDITIEAGFVVERVDEATKSLVSYDGRRIRFDLLVTVPLNMGADFIARSGLGDAYNYVPVDPHTSRSLADDAIFAVGDASSVPGRPKSGAVAAATAEAFVRYFCEHVADPARVGRPAGTVSVLATGRTRSEPRRGAGLAYAELVNAEAASDEPAPASTALDPFALSRRLGASRANPVNHWNELTSRWAYWHLVRRDQTRRVAPVPNGAATAVLTALPSRQAARFSPGRHDRHRLR
ncbi:MAG TPA: FAD-dependent oxidoreductase [Micromonosporaceae bacterium]